MKKLYILFAVFFLSVHIYPQWVKANGPYAGYITTLYAGNGNLYAGSGYYGGVFISSDNGVSWKEVPNLTFTNVNAFAVIKNNLFAATKDWLLLSTNNGTKWSIADSGLIASDLAVIDSNLFAAAGIGVRLSTNMGKSWKQVNNGLKGSSITCLKAIGKTLYANTLNPAYGVFRSSDNGSNWTEVASLPKSAYFTCFAESGTNIFAGAAVYTMDSTGGVFLSADSGATWHAFNPGLPEKANITSLASIGTSIFAGTAHTGIFRYAGGCAGWMPANNGLPPQMWIERLAVSGNKIFASTEGGGVFVSQDSGRSWKTANNGISGCWINNFTSIGNTIFSSAGPAGAFMSTDNGKNWSLLEGLSNKYITVIKAFPKGTDSSYFFAGGDSLYRSTDNGVSWTSVNFGLPKGRYFNSFAKIGTNLFAGANGGVFLSTDNGISWNPVNTGLAPNKHVRHLAVIGQNLFAGTYDNGVYLSTNNGTNWKAVNDSLGNIYISGLAVSGTKLFAGTYYGVALSQDSGKSWILVSSGIKDRTITSLASGTDKNNNTVLFAGTYNGSIYMSPDNGKKWKEVSAGLSYVLVSSLFVNNNMVYAGTGGHSVWQRPLTEMTTGVETVKEIPEKFSLQQNYPNPFNPSTTIRYSVPAESRIKITVYNLLGEEVRVLFDASVRAGNYETVFNAGNLSSGVYFYSLEASSVSGNSYRSTKKLILLK